MNNQDKNLNDILEIVSFIKDTAPTKDDLKNFASKDDIREIRGELKEVRDEMRENKDETITHIDSFIGLHQKLDLELVSLRSKYDRLESSLKKVLDHLKLNA
ncbi:MAG: hypothetical protein NTZ49_02470 [Candidatus Parcubacteria bacterium]|nr:hypothetical protein [Candidatus Parcubacteria bacterium]